MTLLGHTDLGGQGAGANVRALGRYAYVGSWGGGNLCPALGVRVVDLSDPAGPRVVATAARLDGTSAEDLAPLHVSAPSFSGDLLAVGIQRCTRQGQTQARAGLALVDVTDPRHPVDLGFFDTAPAPGGVHELDVVQRDGRVLALLAVPGSEQFGAGDFRIVDITDPRRPVQLAAWGIRSRLGVSEGAGCSRGILDHSVRAGAGGTRAYLSYWDGGVVILDITDPASPQVLGRVFEPDAEGEIHSAAEIPGGLLLVTEEIGVHRPPEGLRLRAEGGGASLEVPACAAPGNTSLDTTGVLTGDLTYAGSACGALAGAAGTVALADPGNCSLAEKARRARAAGARALVVIQDGPVGTPRISANPLDPGADPGLPLIGVGWDDGERLRALVRRGPVSVVLPSARPWGGVRIWDIRDPAHPVRRAIFHTENAERFPPPGPGSYTVHNPLSAGRYALLSWYSDGVRVLDLADPDHPREVAFFVPPAAPDPQRFWAPAAMVWGVALAGDLILASDVNRGLYVLRAEGLNLRP